MPIRYALVSSSTDEERPFHIIDLAAPERGWIFRFAAIDSSGAYETLQVLNAQEAVSS